MSAQERDDGQLLSALSAGDIAAMQPLYERHAAWLSVRLTRQCNDGEVVADVLQDTFVAVWRGAARFGGEGDVAAWLWGIAIRRLVSRLRTRRAVVILKDVSEDPSRSTLAAEEQVLLGIEYGDLGREILEATPTALPARTAALCSMCGVSAVSAAAFGVFALVSLRVWPMPTWLSGTFSDVDVDVVVVMAQQTVISAIGGTLLGVAPVAGCTSAGPGSRWSWRCGSGWC